MNIFNLFKNNQNQNFNSDNKSTKSDYPENVFTNDFSNEIKDEKNYKMQSDFVNPNTFSSPFAYGNNSNNTYNKQASQNQPNSNSLFGNLNIQSLLPLLMSGNSKNGLMQMLTNSNPEMATMLNILNKTNKKQPKTNVEDSCQGFDMSSYTKCSDYFKR